MFVATSGWVFAADAAAGASGDGDEAGVGGSPWPPLPAHTLAEAAGRSRASPRDSLPAPGRRAGRGSQQTVTPQSAPPRPGCARQRSGRLVRLVGLARNGWLPVYGSAVNAGHPGAVGGRRSAALPGEQCPVESAGGEVLGSDQPVEHANVAPHHVRVVVAVDLGPQQPPIGLTSECVVTPVDAGPPAPPCATSYSTSPCTGQAYHPPRYGLTPNGTDMEAGQHTEPCGSGPGRPPGQRNKPIHTRPRHTHQPHRHRHQPHRREEAQPCSRPAHSEQVKVDTKI